LAVASPIGMVAGGAVTMAALPGTSITGAGGLLQHLLIQDIPSSTSVNQPWFWYIAVAILQLYPWISWTSLWFAIGRARAEFESAEVRLCLAAVAIIFLIVLWVGGQTSDLLPLLPPVALIIARVWANYSGKARDFHAAVPGLLALFVCLFFFMLN